MHSDIHAVIHDVPVPNGNICKDIYQKLCRAMLTGEISLNDSAIQRLNWLIARLLENACPITAAVLSWQRDKITKFYEGS